VVVSLKWLKAFFTFIFLAGTFFTKPCLRNINMDVDVNRNMDVDKDIHRYDHKSMDNDAEKDTDTATDPDMELGWHMYTDMDGWTCPRCRLCSTR
jgi:hypothetical protein